MNWSWMKNPAFLIQGGHFLTAYALFLTAAQFLPFPWLWIIAGLEFAYIVWKETIFDPDPAVEKEPFFWAGALDTVCFLAGLSAAITISFLRG